MLARLTLVFLFSAISIVTLAQGEIVAGYGIFAANEASGDYSRPSFLQTTTLASSSSYEVEGKGPWMLGFKYEVTPNITFGILGVYSVTNAIYNETVVRNGIESSTSQKVVSNQYSSLVHVSYSWWDYDLLTFYSSVAAGVSYGVFKNSSESIRVNKYAPAYQINALGVRAGAQFGVFLELGYGYAGVANVGLSLYLK